MILQENTRLPDNFAQKVLQLESMVDDSLSMDLINDLNQLYRIGIDYYIQYEPHKARHFQRKMTRLLANPATLNIIEYRSQNKMDSGKVSQLPSRNKIRDQISKFQSCQNQYIKNMMEQSDRAIKKNEKLKEIHMNKQEEHLQNRIMLKKYRSQQKFMKLSGLQQKA